MYSSEPMLTSSATLCSLHSSHSSHDPISLDDHSHSRADPRVQVYNRQPLRALKRGTNGSLWGLDPKVTITLFISDICNLQIELDNLNASTDLINKLELELNVCLFEITLVNVKQIDVLPYFGLTLNVPTPVS